jgi:tetratricopeptide (TPR) repeat protein
MQSLQQQLQSGKDLQGRPLSAQQMQNLQQQLQRLQATLQAMQNPNQANLQAQMNDLQRQIDELQKQLQSGKDANGNPLSKEQMEQLKKQLELLQQQMRALKLSQEAQEFLRKLMNDPAYKEAMEHLRKLAEQMQKLNQQQDPQQRKLTQEEIEKRLQELERKLEELAKKYNTDEKIRELAQQLLEQVKQMKELSQCQGACLGLGMGNCFGLGMGMGGAFGTKQKQAWDKGEFVGQPELFNQGDKQPELKIPMKDTAISGQPPLVPGAGDYMDYNAPPTPGGSSIPLTKRCRPTRRRRSRHSVSRMCRPPSASA